VKFAEHAIEHSFRHYLRLSFEHRMLISRFYFAAADSGEELSPQISTIPAAIEVNGKSARRGIQGYGIVAKVRQPWLARFRLSPCHRPHPRPFDHGATGSHWQR
jgi:hypothetical protein